MMDRTHQSRRSDEEQQYRQLPQQQGPYQIEPRQRRLYMVIGMLLTFLGFFLLTRSRFVQTFVPPIPNNLPSAPPRWFPKSRPSSLPKSRPSSRNTKVHPTNLYRFLHHNMVTGIVIVVAACISALFPVLYFTAHWLNRFQRGLENAFTRILVRILSFSLSTMAFYMSTRVGTRAFLTGNLPTPRTITLLMHDFNQMFDLHFEGKQEIQSLLFVDPWTIGTVAIFSISSVCLARLLPNPGTFYHLHEVLLDLTCHLAGDYFGSSGFASLLIFGFCLLVIIVKELTEPRRHVPQAPPAQAPQAPPAQVPQDQGPSGSRQIVSKTSYKKSVSSILGSKGKSKRQAETQEEARR